MGFNSAFKGLKKEAPGRTLGRTRFKWGNGPVVRKAMK